VYAHGHTHAHGILECPLYACQEEGYTLHSLSFPFLWQDPLLQFYAASTWPLKRPNPSDTEDETLMENQAQNPHGHYQYHVETFRLTKIHGSDNMIQET